MLTKNAHYRLAVMLEDRGFPNLCEILNEGYSASLDVGATAIVFPYGPDLECMVAKTDPSASSSMFHFVVYEAGATAPVIKRLKDKMQLGEISTQNNDDEFIKYQVFLYVFADHVLFVTHNNVLRGDGVLGLTSELANQKRDVNNGFVFGLTRVGNETVLQDAFDKGIEYIDLGLGNFADSLDMLLTGGSLKEGALRSFLGRDDYTEDEETAMAETKAKLVLKPSRAWKRDNVKRLLSTIAYDTKNLHGDEFAIKVKGGPKLTQANLTVQREISVEGSKALIVSSDMAVKLHTAFVAMRAENLIG